MTDKSAEGRHHFFDLIKLFSQGMFVSKDLQGHVHARPMYVAKAIEGEGVWFFTNIDSPKVVEIESDPSVNVCFQASDKFLSLSGQALVSRDKNKISELWSEMWRPWFPNGKESTDLCLICVQPEVGEYWDQSGVMRKLRFAFEAGKSLAFHTRIDDNKVGDNMKVDLLQQPLS